MTNNELSATAPSGSSAPIRSLVSPCGTTVVTIAPRDAIGRLGRRAELRRPGIYIGIWRGLGGTKAYVGRAAEDVAKRVQSQPDVRGLFPADEVVVITSSTSMGLSAEDAAALERVAHAALKACRDLEVANRAAPIGVPGHPDLARIHLAWSGAAVTAKRAGTLFPGTSERDLIAGPQHPLQEPRPIRHTREQVRRLSTPDLPVYAVPHCDGTWTLLEGSELAAEPQPRTSFEARMLRAELVHAGLLVAEPWMSGRLLVTSDLRLRSASACVVLAAGIDPRQVSPEAWRPLAPGEHAPYQGPGALIPLMDEDDEPQLLDLDQDEGARGPDGR